MNGDKPVTNVLFRPLPLVTTILPFENETKKKYRQDKKFNNAHVTQVSRWSPGIKKHLKIKQTKRTVRKREVERITDNQTAVHDGSKEKEQSIVQQLERRA